jgi:hypothetical protein
MDSDIDKLVSAVFLVSQLCVLVMLVAVVSRLLEQEETRI